jgi:hypothetical protein
MSLVGHWNAHDSSLSSAGQWPTRTVALTPPPINGDLIGHTLAAAGYPASPANLRRMAEVYLDQFLVKSYQFIEGAQGPRSRNSLLTTNGGVLGANVLFCRK